MTNWRGKYAGGAKNWEDRWQTKDIKETPSRKEAQVRWVMVPRGGEPALLQA